MNVTGIITLRLEELPVQRAVVSGKQQPYIAFRTHGLLRAMGELK
jgi:hypothetical protein